MSDIAADGVRERVGRGVVVTAQEQRKVVFASSLGTVFEWYDFYLYATLAPFFAALFFPVGNDTAALLSAFATYAAGFLVRPFGALVFGRIGDLVGRKYTFIVTILVMGVDLRGRPAPTYAPIGWLAPVPAGGAAPAAGPGAGRRIWRRRDLCRGACAGRQSRLCHELDPDHRNARASSCRSAVIGFAAPTWTTATFASWGWRLPFLVSLVLLVFSIYIRLKLNESPVFQQMKAEGRASRSPLTDSFLRYPNNR